VNLSSRVANYVSIGWAGITATNNALAFIVSDRDAYATWFDRKGSILGTVGPNGISNAPEISPDGRKAVFPVTDVGRGTADLWICDLVRNTSTRVTSSDVSEGYPVWSPDARTLAFCNEVDGPPHVFTMNLSSGAQTEIVPRRGIQYTSDWTPDGKQIVFSELSPMTRRDIWLVAPHAGARTEPWLRTPFYEGQARVSPDGKWMLYISDSSGTRELWAAPFDHRGDALQISSGGASRGVWNHDGTEVFFEGPKNHLYAARIRYEPQLEADPPQLLFTDPGGAEWLGFDVSLDGQKFLVGRVRSGPPTNPVHVVINWKQLLEKK
jgi:Tol biopolymer transport system component